MKTISPDVLDVLKRSTCEGSALVLPEQLDRKLYVATNKVLKALGGMWNRQGKVHLFDGDAAELVGDVVSTGTYLDRKQELGFFETPAAVADQLLEGIEFRQGMRILEPSAGRGFLCQAMIERGAVAAEIVSVDIDPRHATLLVAMNLIHIEGDFLALRSVSVFPFDVIVMNPPFARSADIAHVRHAWKFLKPGGKLAAITAIGWTFREDEKAKVFRDWLEEIGATHEELPAGAFKSSGTMVRTAIVRAVKGGAS